jgi:hypothetical protein
MGLFENWGEDLHLPSTHKKVQPKLHIHFVRPFPQATLSMLILLLLNLRCAYSSVTSNVFTF